MVKEVSCLCAEGKLGDINMNKRNENKADKVHILPNYGRLRGGDIKKGAYYFSIEYLVLESVISVTMMHRPE